MVALVSDLGADVTVCMADQFQFLCTDPNSNVRLRQPKTDRSGKRKAHHKVSKDVVRSTAYERGSRKGFNKKLNFKPGEIATPGRRQPVVLFLILLSITNYV